MKDSLKEDAGNFDDALQQSLDNENRLAKLMMS